MKKNIKLSLFFLLAHSLVSGQVKDSIGYSIISKQLLVIKNYLDDPNSDTTLKRVSVIRFLTFLTGIGSESDGNYIGQLSPTKRDYLLWEQWLIINRENIFWDEKSGAVIIHNERKPPKW
jgi:hypothetical protein